MPPKVIPPTCTELEKLNAAKDVIGVLNHSRLACQDCAKKRLYNKFNGDELLFKNALPPWLTPPPEQTADQSTNNVEKKKRNFPSKAKPVICPEDIDEHLYKRSWELSDSALVHEITKLKHLDKEAAFSAMIDLRKRKKEEEVKKREEKILQPEENGDEPQVTEKKINRPNMLPWCPEPKHLFPRGETSALNQGAQARFLAICQNLMNTGTARFQSNLKELKAFELKAEKERKTMEERIIEQTILLSEQSDARKQPLATIKGRAASFVIQRWVRLWAGDKRRFNRLPQKVFDWKSEIATMMSFNTPELEVVLQRGRADKIDLPSLRNRCPLVESSVFEQFPPDASVGDAIFDDENIIPLCLENGVKFAMDATTCCHLMADSFVGKSQNYAIPITISQHIYSGSFHPVIVFGKPRVLGSVNNVTVMRQFIKYEIKSSFIKRTHLKETSSLRQEFSPAKKERNMTKSSSKNDQDSAESSTKNDQDSAESSTKNEQDSAESSTKNEQNSAESSTKNDQDSAESSTKNEQNSAESSTKKEGNMTKYSQSKQDKDISESSLHEEVRNNDLAENIASGFSDPLDSILDKILPTSLTVPSKPRASENGKQYVLFNANGFRFLVRSRPSPICSVGPLFVQGKPLSIQPKIEYAPVAGAMCLGNEEWMWNYAKETFKQTNNHCLFRVHYDGYNVLQLQHSEPRQSERDHPCSPHMTRSTTSNRRSLDNEKKELVSSRTNRFTQLLENIAQLPVGRYLLLNENDEKLKLLSEIDNDYVNTSDVLDCSTIAKSIVLTREVPKFQDIFEGLESRIPLQWQAVQRRAPGCFVAKDSKLHFLAITPLMDNAKDKKFLKRDGNQKRRGIKRKRFND